MAFKKLYECEFCGKTKYFFPEQAIGAKCECEETNDKKWHKKSEKSCATTDEYNLKPIKKEWYENPDNLGKLIIVDEAIIAFFTNYNVNTIECIDLKNKAQLFTSIDKCRPGTEEEVLSLLVK